LHCEVRLAKGDGVLGRISVLGDHPGSCAELFSHMAGGRIAYLSYDDLLFYLSYLCYYIVGY
jgi:hypothetical protein